MENNITLGGDEVFVNVTDLLPGTEYVFRVLAVASDGQTSPLSTALVATTGLRAPGMYLLMHHQFNLKALTIIVHSLLCVSLS